MPGPVPTPRPSPAPGSGPATPGGTRRPAPPPPRPAHATQQEIQATSQEIVAEKGLVPSEDEVERRVIIKRAGRAISEAKKSTFWTKATAVALLTVYFAGDELKAWARAHAETAYGLVGLFGILLGGYTIAVRVLARAGDGGGDSGHGGPPSGAS